MPGEGSTFFFPLPAIKSNTFYISRLAIKSAGKMSFSLSAVDELLGHPDEWQAIGLEYCRPQKREITEYTLRDIRKPMGVATFSLGVVLPEEIRVGLLTIEEIEERLRE